MNSSKPSSCSTMMALKPFTIDGHRNDTPIQMLMSNTLDPNALLTAISPFPCFAASTELKQSGNELPIANNVKPITSSLILRQFPIFSAASTQTKVRTPSHTKTKQNDSISFHVGDCPFVFGTVHLNAKWNGDIAPSNTRPHPLGL